MKIHYCNDNNYIITNINITNLKCSIIPSIVYSDNDFSISNNNIDYINIYNKIDSFNSNNNHINIDNNSNNIILTNNNIDNDIPNYFNPIIYI